MEVLQAQDQKSLSRTWDSFLDHRSKGYSWLLPLLRGMESEVSDENFIKLTNPKSDFTLIPHNLKMRAMYVGVDKQKSPIKPCDTISKDLAEYFLATAITVSTDGIIWRKEECLQIWVKYNVPPGIGDRILMFEELIHKNLITKKQGKGIIQRIKNSQSPTKE